MMRHRRQRHLVVRLLLAAVLFVYMAMPAYAGRTELHVAASKSYVTSSGPVIILVGDSRVMMCTYVKGNSSARRNFAFCWVNGGNVSVIRNGGNLSSHLNKMIRKYRSRCSVVFNMGVNGNSSPASNARKIKSIYRSWMNRYPDVPFYVASVNPTVAKSGPYSNSKVVKLNQYLKAAYEPEGRYIDTYSALVSSGLVTGKARGMRDQYHYKWNAGKVVLKTVRRYVMEHPLT